MLSGVVSEDYNGMMTRIRCCSLTRFYLCKFLTGFLLVTFLYVSYKAIGSINNGARLAKLSAWVYAESENKLENTINIDDTLLKSGFRSMSFSRDEYINSCPICFGTTICDNIDVGALTILGKPHKGIYKGMWHKSTKVQVKLVSKERLNHYKQFICQNITKSAACPTLKNGVSFKKSFFDVNEVRNIYKLTLQQRSDIPYVWIYYSKVSLAILFISSYQL